jgi:hypothetical protein
VADDRPQARLVGAVAEPLDGRVVEPWEPPLLRRLDEELEALAAEGAGPLDGLVRAARCREVGAESRHVLSHASVLETAKGAKTAKVQQNHT